MSASRSGYLQRRELPARLLERGFDLRAFPVVLRGGLLHGRGVAQVPGLEVFHGPRERHGLGQEQALFGLVRGGSDYEVEGDPRELYADGASLLLPLPLVMLLEERDKDV